MISKRWMKLVLAILVIALVPVAVAAAAGPRMEKKVGPATVGAPANLPQRADGPSGWAPPGNGLGLEETQKPPAPLMPVTWKEGFEYAWPNSIWWVFDNNGVDYPNENYDLCWNDVSYRRSKGGWSGWPAAGCSDGYPAPGYAPNMDSWMVLGPFSTSGAKAGNFSFKYWLDSEAGWDWFGWCASSDGYSFNCTWRSGFSGAKFVKGSMNLKTVPGYGNMLGEPYVWVAWIFQSDDIIQGDYGYEGVYVDDIAVVIK